MRADHGDDLADAGNPGCPFAPHDEGVTHLRSQRRAGLGEQILTGDTGAYGLPHDEHPLESGRATCAVFPAP